MADESKKYGVNPFAAALMAGGDAISGIYGQRGNTYGNYLDALSKRQMMEAEAIKAQQAQAMEMYQKQQDSIAKYAQMGMRPIDPAKAISPGGNMPSQMVNGPYGMNFVPSPTLQKNQMIDTGMRDDAGNPIFKSKAQAAFDARTSNQEDSLWKNFVKQNDVATASSRSTLGMAGNANIRADRAITILKSPIVTNQDAQMVIADLAGVMQGGAPTDQAMKHSEYQTLQQKVAGLQQYLSGKPTDAVPQKIKDKLIEQLNGLKAMDYEYIKRHISYQEKANPKLISKRKSDWEEMKKALLSGYEDTGSNIQEFNVNGKTYRVPADEVEAFKKDMRLK